MEFINRAQAKNETGVTYLGSVNLSHKIKKNAKLGVATYILYLAPSTLSGYNVCPKATPDCIHACLNESGHNRINVQGYINRARAAKTRLFFEDRPYFMQWLVAEISAHKARAEADGHHFSVRINGTSDLSLDLFKMNGETLPQMFPDVQFYDYTKVFNRVKLLEKYSNYDLTFSYSGYNWNECENALNQGVRVAVVFDKQLPAFYKGLPVINGDISDVRYLDARDVIVGLRFKKVRNRIDVANQQFIVPFKHPDCVY